MKEKNTTINIPIEYVNTINKVIRTGLKHVNLPKPILIDIKMWWEAEYELTVESIDGALDKKD